MVTASMKCDAPPSKCPGNSESIIVKEPVPACPLGRGPPSISLRKASTLTLSTPKMNAGGVMSRDQGGNVYMRPGEQRAGALSSWTAPPGIYVDGPIIPAIAERPVLTITNEALASLAESSYDRVSGRVCPNVTLRSIKERPPAVRHQTQRSKRGNHL